MKFRNIAVIFALAAALTMSACNKAKVQDEQSIPNAPTAPVEDVTMGDSDSGKAMGLQTVHFPYDSFVIDDEAKRVLSANAEIMNGKPSLKVQIEGHCDQRGGIQYNIALGEKRANALKKILEEKGIAADRLSTISYGKERPVDQATTEDAYAKNRRGNFVITTR